MAEMILVLKANPADMVGHLVRGVQMMFSYGKEFRIQETSSVYAIDPPAGERLIAAIHAGTSSGLDELPGLLGEVEWSLGRLEEAEGALAVYLAAYRNAPTDAWKTTSGLQKSLAGPAGSELRAALAEVSPELAPAGGATIPPAAIHLTQKEFQQICEQGQRMGDHGEEIIGRQPSAGGWGS